MVKLLDYTTLLPEGFVEEGKGEEEGPGIDRERILVQRMYSVLDIKYR